MAAAARSALLKHVRVRVAGPASPAVSVSFGHLLRRCFSEEAKGSFLDKSEVADRIITVVKNFQKVDDPSKNVLLPIFLRIICYMSRPNYFRPINADCRGLRLLEAAQYSREPRENMPEDILSRRIA